MANMINEAAINAVKHGVRLYPRTICLSQLKLLLPERKKDRILGEEEKKTVAYHEVGRAELQHCKGCRASRKLLSPRTMGSLISMQVPEEEKYLTEKLNAKLITLLAGRSRGACFCYSLTEPLTISSVTDIARAMVHNMVC